MARHKEFILKLLISKCQSQVKLCHEVFCMYCVATPISLFCFNKTAGMAQLERLRDVDFSYSVEGGAKLYSRDRNALSDMLARPKSTYVGNLWNRTIIDKSK